MGSVLNSPEFRVFLFAYEVWRLHLRAHYLYQPDNLPPNPK